MLECSEVAVGRETDCNISPFTTTMESMVHFYRSIGGGFKRCKHCFCPPIFEEDSHVDKKVGRNRHRVMDGNVGMISSTKVFA